MAQITINHDARRDIASRGFAWIPRRAWLIEPELEPHWQRMRLDWDHLELDRYLENGATFRLRRYGRYYWSPASSALLALPAQPYFQPKAENAYAGGIERRFALLLPETMQNPFLPALVRCTFACLPLPEDKKRQGWEVRIHQIRIVATRDAPGQPAPEGIHQDGADFLTLHLVRRDNIVGGTSTIYDLARQPIESFTMQETLDSLILEDPRIMHGVTPVHPANAHMTGIRDLLGVDFIHSPWLERPGANA